MNEWLGGNRYAYDYQCHESSDPPADDSSGSAVVDWCHVTNATYFNIWATSEGDSPTAARGVLAAAIGGERWSNLTRTPFLYYRSTGWDAGQIHRVDYDNPRSLSIKSAYARSVGARGVGMWTADLIDDGNKSARVRSFWDAFHPFTKPLPSQPSPQV